MDIFEITGLLGSGQFSTVYKAKWINAPLTPAYSYSPENQNSLIAQPSYGDAETPVLPNNHSHHHQHRHPLQQDQLMDQGNDNIQIIWNEYDKSQAMANATSGGQADNKTGAQNNKTNSCAAFKYVALKRIKFYEIPNSKLRVDCEKEVKLLQQLKHPNIINCNISFFRRNELYIVLELADGGDLSKLIRYYEKKKQLICERVILKFFTQVCSAVKYIHSKRILHRDIKPANIFITPDGCVKLGDFGLGRFFSQNTLDAHSFVGTFYYMSPERILESGYEFSSDVWSLGCVLYELITWNSPFSIMNVEQQQQQQAVDITNNVQKRQNNRPQQPAYQNRHYQQQQQQQHHNPYNLQWLIDRIIRVEYPSLINYTNISLRLRQLTAECLNQNPDARPNMDYICAVVDEAYRIQLMLQTMQAPNGVNTAKSNTNSAVSCRQ